MSASKTALLTALVAAGVVVADQIAKAIVRANISRFEEHELFLGIKEEAWPKGTDGVYFRVGIALGDTYKDLLTRNVDPYRVGGDRGWIPISIDLSEYAGKTVNVVFNTHESLPGVAPNGMYDFAVFGAPRIVVVPQS